MLIVGSSGAGKMALLMRLLLEPLNYDIFLVFARSLHQPEYEIHKAGMENNLPKCDIIKLLNFSSILKKNNCDTEPMAAAFRHDNDEHNVEPSTIESELHSSSDDISDPSELDTSIHNLIVFDDIMTDKKNKQLLNVIILVEDHLIVIIYIYLKITLIFH